MPVSATRKELIVGVVFMGIMVVLGFFTIIVGQYKPWQPPTDIYVKFPAVGGLREGNVVRITGLEVGQVRRMRRVPDGVLAELRLQMSAEEFDLHEGHIIRVKAFSPLGGKYVDIDRGTLTAPLAENRGFDPLRPLQGGIEPELVTEAAELVAAIRPPLEETARNLAEATAKLNTLEGTIGKFLGDPAVYDNIAKASAELASASEKINLIVARVESGEGSVGKAIKDPSLYDAATGTLQKLDGLLASLAEAGEPGPPLGGFWALMVEERRGSIAGRLLYDQQMGTDLAATVADIREITRGVRAGEGSVGKALRDPTLHDELVATLDKAQEALGSLATVLDEDSAKSLRATIENIEEITAAIREGRGTIGGLVMDRALLDEAQRVIVELRESVEDVREQAPINAFIGAVFSAF